MVLERAFVGAIVAGVVNLAGAAQAGSIQVVHSFAKVKDMLAERGTMVSRH